MAEQVLRHKPDIRRTLRQPAHEIRIPLLAKGDVNLHTVSLPDAPLDLVPPDAVDELKFITIRR